MDLTRPEFEGFILIGGASSRMGVDKAGLMLGGQTFVERIRAALTSITTNIKLVGTKEGSAPQAYLPTIPDLHVKWGALGGLHAALASCVAEWAAVVACDLPLVTGELFVRLASLRDDVDAVVPVQSDGRRQPLCALYRTLACRDRVEALIAAGERRPRALLEAVRTRLVAFAELSELKGAPEFFLNVNSPDDFAEATRRRKALIDK